MLIGIDFGTTTTCAAFHDGRDVSIIETVNGSRTMPSVVSLQKAGPPLVGEPARRELERRPDYTYQSIKRALGQRYDDNVHDSFQMRRGKDGLVAFQGEDRLYSAVELTAHIFSSVITATELQLGEKPTGAVITVPALFADHQRSAIIDAAVLAGFDRDKVHIMEEPTAAAMACGFGERKFTRIGVFDLGGGTMDATILQCDENLSNPVAVDGDMFLGGDDFDELLIEYIVKQHHRLGGDDIAADNAAMTRVSIAAQDAKHALSSATKARIYLKDITWNEGENRFNTLDFEIERSDYEVLAKPLIDRCIKVIERTLEKANMTKDEVDDWLLVGSMTRTPAIRAAFKAFTGKDPKSNIPPEEMVARGAAKYAAMKDNRIKPSKLNHIATVSTGIRSPNGQMMVLIAKGQKLPFAADVLVKSIEDNQKHITIEVVQGETVMADSCLSLTKYHKSIPLAGAGEELYNLQIAQAKDGTIVVTLDDEIIHGAN